MDFKTLHKKYVELLLENTKLKDELKRLKIHLDKELNCNQISDGFTIQKIISYHTEPESSVPKAEIESSTSNKIINKRSDAGEKIKLFMSLFKGREDVYAKRWENKSKETAGYSPHCNNEWKPGICQKPKIKCSLCQNQDFLPLNELAIDAHLRGRQGLIAGIYPLLADETCWFLAIDFDDEGWQKDIMTLREVCSLFKIPIAVERSRSGNGAHAWFFFKHPVPASLARKFGSALLTYAMNRRHKITFKSYDRFFPNQDTIPKGGFGNLIALPLQKAARKYNNSIFINENFQPLEDQ